MVGFTGRLGTLTLGRLYTMLYWSILDADILGTNTYGSGSLDPYLPNAHADNAISYRGTFSGLTDAYRYSGFRDARYAVPMTGPSATADIEGVLVRGAQAIRTLTVIALAA